VMVLAAVADLMILPWVVVAWVVAVRFLGQEKPLEESLAIMFGMGAMALLVVAAAVASNLAMVAMVVVVQL